MNIESLLEIILLRILNFRITSSNINSINLRKSIILIIKIYRNIFENLFTKIKIILYILLDYLFRDKLIIISFFPNL